MYKVTLLPEALEILYKYDFKFPLISGQKQNLYLKAVGDEKL